MTCKQQTILNQLGDAKNLLQSALIDIKLENIDGQFDYCTNSTLASLTDDINSLMSRINTIVYQK